MHNNQRARGRKAGFHVWSLEEFKAWLEANWITHCPYLGIELVYGRTGDGSCASIDRIDSSKGYYEGNVQIVSWQANWMKSAGTEREFIEACCAVADRYQKGLIHDCHPRR